MTDSQTIMNTDDELYETDLAVTALLEKITAEDRAMATVYEAIGRRYTQLYGAQGDPSFEDLMGALRASQERVEACNERIRSLKAAIACPYCGTALTEEAMFCTRCGAGLYAPVEQEAVSDCPTEAVMSEDPVCEEPMVEEAAAEETVPEETTLEQAEIEETTVEDFTSEESGTSDTLLCTNCGAELEADSRFCVMCGAKAEVAAVEADAGEESLRVCTNCGAVLEADSRFCVKCGAKTEQTVVPTARFCTGCGQALQEGSLFCVRCGMRAV